jgi:hypothetical protein
VYVKAFEVMQPLGAELAHAYPSSGTFGLLGSGASEQAQTPAATSAAVTQPRATPLAHLPVPQQLPVHLPRDAFVSNHSASQVSYVDELLARRKEILRLLMQALAVMLGLALHYFFSDHVMLPLVNGVALASGRELLARLMYPVAIVFVGWNLRVLAK